MVPELEGGNDVTKSDVTLFCEAGSHIQCNFEVISDYGVAKNIIVDGYGTFEVLFSNFGKGVVFTSNPLSTIFFRGERIEGITNGILTANATSFDIKVNIINCITQYPINFRGNIEGSIEFGEITTGNSIAILLRNIGTDLVARKIYIKGRKVYAETSSFNGGVVSTISSFNTIAYFSDFDIEHSNTEGGGLFDIWSGLNYFKNISAVSTGGYGFQTWSQGSVNLLEGCNIVALMLSMYARFSSRIEAVDCQFIANDTSNRGAVQIQDTCELDMRNCFIHQRTLSSLPSIVQVNNNFLRLSNCKMVSGSEMTESIRATAPRLISVELQCATDKPVNANITNIVAGTNIIVDVNVKPNTNTFFK